MSVCSPERLEHSFDRMSKALANGISRRDALKWVGAGVLGTMVSAVGVRNAEAWASRCTPNPPPDGTCGNQVVCGPPQPGFSGCRCTPKVRANGSLSARGFCWQDQFCSNVVPCLGSKFCKTNVGLNYKCVATCCASPEVPGHCFPKCETVPPCCSAQVAGATGAG